MIWVLRSPGTSLGVVSGLGAALLFGAGTPAAKLLLGPVSPLLLAGLLYLGSGIGLAVYRVLFRVERPSMSTAEIGWLIGAVLFGGMLGPALLMWGLALMPASGASLLLNAEGVLTALLAWFVFRENFDRRIAIGMGFIVAGAIVLSWPEDMRVSTVMPSLLVLGACLCWAIDNNFTRKVALLDASFIAMTKGLAAGSVNTALAVATGAVFPSVLTTLTAGGVGLLSYGVSLVLFVRALRHLGTARTGAYFSTAPFAGALIGVLAMGEPLTAQLALAGILMGVGVWLHLSEHHGHLHAHDPVGHDHEHKHDEHHRHEHQDTAGSAAQLSPSHSHSHSHWHRHEPLAHSHAHYPDAHHRHHH